MRQSSCLLRDGGRGSARIQGPLALGLMFFAAQVAHAQPITHFGARAMGMGGAFVAVADDASSVYWNPAGLAIGSKRAVMASIGGKGGDRQHMLEEMKELVDLSVAAGGRISAPSDIERALVLLDGLSQQGSGLVGDATIDVILAYRGFAFAFLDTGTAAAAPSIDEDILAFDPHSGRPLPTDLAELHLTGLVAKQLSASYAAPIIEGRLWGGGSLKYYRADTYDVWRLLVDTENKELTRTNIVRRATGSGKAGSSSWGVDLGVMAYVLRHLRVGLVGRDMNGPEFDSVGPAKVELNPQYRMGASYELLPSMVVAADYDLSKNDQAIPGVPVREASFGVEGYAADRHLAIRGGASKNVDEKGSLWQFSFGLGVDTPHVAFDAAFVTDSKNEQVSGALTAIVRF